MRLIALAGGRGVGKDHVAKTAFAPLGYLPYALADFGKVWMVARGLITYEQAFYRKNAEDRTLMQEELTERGRDVYGQAVWVNALMAQLRVFEERWQLTNFVITDARFHSEFDAIKAAGGQVFLVHAPERYAMNGLTDAQRAHQSEVEWRTYPWYQYDGIIQNDWADQDDRNVFLKEQAHKLHLRVLQTT